MSGPRAVAAILLVAATSGCMTLKDNRLPRRNYSEIVPKRGPVAVDYDLTIRINGVVSQQQNARTQYHDGLEKVAAQAGCFSSFKEGRGLPWHVSFDFDDAAEDHGTAILCGLTILVFPCFIDENYTLTVTVSHDNQVVKTYVYKDGILTIMEPLLIFMTPFFPLWTAAEETNTNMVVNFLCDLTRDDILTPEGPRVAAPPTAAPSAPPAATPPPSQPDVESLPSAPAASKEDR